MPRSAKKSPTVTAPSPRLGDPRGAAQALRQLLASRVQTTLALGVLDRETADELAKIAAILEKLEASGYDLKTAALEMGERLGDFASRREPDPTRLAWLADLLEAFYASLGQEA